MAPRSSRTGVSSRHDEAGVRRQVERLDSSDHLVAQIRIEVHAVRLEQLAGGGVVAFGA